jgi:hypothetical protein
MSFTAQEAIDKKEELVMHTGKPYGKALLAGFVIAGALVLALPLPSQAQVEQSGAGKTRAPLDPYYAENYSDYQLKMHVKWHLAMSPWVDADFLHIYVRDGVVTLRGSVENESARAAAIRNAKQAGAKEVIDHLNVEDKGK